MSERTLKLYATAILLPAPAPQAPFFIRKFYKLCFSLDAAAGRRRALATL